MALLTEMPTSLSQVLEQLECPQFADDPWVEGPPLSERRVAIISTAGLQQRGDRPFTVGASDYRMIPGDLSTADIVMSHVSTNFDRTGFQFDVNIAFPIDRLRELAADGVIGSVADFHYSFMGATAPEDMAGTVDFLAPILKQDHVDAVVLVPI
jgi:D-proline reductase (dithiol) PrdB